MRSVMLPPLCYWASSHEPGWTGWPGWQGWPGYTRSNLALGSLSYEKFQLGFRDLKRPNILVTSSGTKCEKESKLKANMAKHKNHNFRAHHSFGSLTLIAVSVYQCSYLGCLWRGKYSGNARRWNAADPSRQSSTRFHPGNRAEVNCVAGAWKQWASPSRARNQAGAPRSFLRSLLPSACYPGA